MDNRSRFDGRAEIYDKFRPGFPDGMFTRVVEETKLELNIVIADIGTGTGKSCQWFLDAGYPVWGIEPNIDMINFATKLKKLYPNFHLIQNDAENTGLKEDSVDLIISGQAIQYFYIPQVRNEFLRILKKSGWVAIFWYSEKPQTQFEEKYYQLVNKYRINDYGEMDIRATRPHRIKTLFQNKVYQEFSFLHSQNLDKEGILGRTLSSSHMPKENSEQCNAMMSDLESLLDNDRQFVLNYETHLYIGRLK